VEDLILVHRKSLSKAQGASPIVLTTSGAVWKTCLRQIVFFEEASFCFHCEKEDQILRGAEAFKFLLEVLTGLQSPVLGETEVLGQFRLFIESRRALGDQLFANNRKWLNFLMAEVKRIRSEFICGLGSNSYGGIIRQYSKGLNSVTIMGSGHLAKEILPWMLTKPSVQMVARNPQNVTLDDAKYDKIQLSAYEGLQDLGEVLVIAAPLSDLEIRNHVLQQGVRLSKIFDLRGESNQLKNCLAPFEVKVLSLEDMFDELAGSRKENEHKVSQIKLEILKRVDQFMERSELRPMGWDDICA